MPKYANENRNANQGENAGKPISDIYPKFLNWSKSDGEQDQDWYLHPVEEQ